MHETRHIDYLDGWRGISILLVLAGHFYLLPFYTGRLGVELFFVLSGRLMAEILFVRETPIGVFYWRRITRIFPAFWLFLGGMSLAYQFLPSLDIAAKDVLTSITFTKNYARLAATSPGFGHIWSLCVEEQAYVILSVVAIAKRRFKLNVIVLLWVMTAAAASSGAFQTWVMHRDFYGVYWHTDARLASITLPAVLYLHSRSWGAQMDRISRLVPIISVLTGATISIPDSIPDPIKYTFGTGLLAFGLVTLQFSWKLVTQVLSNPILRYFGLWSFSLYLWQDPFFQLQDQYPKALLLSITMIISLASFYLVERPVRRYLNGLAPQPVRPRSRSGQSASSETEQPPC